LWPTASQIESRKTLLERNVIAAVDDMFFAAKIRATAEHVGTQVRFSRDLQSIIEAARETKAALIIVDLHATRFDPLALARTLKADPHLSATSLLGFFSHVQTALMQQAQEAGYDHVLPRSAFTARLAEILR
jgi:PleD family two-component response regulator